MLIPPEILSPAELKIESGSTMFIYHPLASSTATQQSKKELLGVGLQ